MVRRFLNDAADPAVWSELITATVFLFILSIVAGVLS